MFQDRSCSTLASPSTIRTAQPTAIPLIPMHQSLGSSADCYAPGTAQVAAVTPGKIGLKRGSAKVLIVAQGPTTYCRPAADKGDEAEGAPPVTGAGKAFSAGGDFEMIPDHRPAARMTTWKEAKDLVYNVINCNKPIISAINGVAVGAGFGRGYPCRYFDLREISADC